MQSQEQPLPVPQQAPAGGMTEEQKLKVDSLSQMGFEKEECENALKAAFWFEDRAIDYLLNGIPEDVMDAIAQGQAQPQAQANATPQQVAPQGGNTGQGGVGQEGDPLAGIPPEIVAQIHGLTQNPQFMELRNYARQNPQMVLPQIAAMIQQNNPQLWAFFEQDTALFVSLILGAPSEQQGQPGQQAPAENPNEIRLSQSDNDAVKRLEAFGFEQYTCFEAYSVCDKNEEMALSMLFDNADKAQNQAPPVQQQALVQPQIPAPQESAPVNPAPQEPEQAPQNNDNLPATDDKPDEKKDGSDANKMDEE